MDTIVHFHDYDDCLGLLYSLLASAAYISMASCSKTSNCNDNEQEQDQDQYRSLNNSSGFLHDYPSHHDQHPGGHVQTSNDHQFLFNGSNHKKLQVLSTTRSFVFVYQ